MQTEQITDALATAWAMDDCEFGGLMTALCLELWDDLRPNDLFPGLSHLAQHLAGIGPSDGDELVLRLLSFGKRRLDS